MLHHLSDFKWHDSLNSWLPENNRRYWWTHSDGAKSIISSVKDRGKLVVVWDGESYISVIRPLETESPRIESEHVEGVVYDWCGIYTLNGIRLDGSKGFFTTA